jgi:hypothetical protein
MNDIATQKPQAARRRGKRLVLALLAALAAFMYVSIIVKVVNFGF